MGDLSSLTAATKNEFGIFTKKGERLLFRGYTNDLGLTENKIFELALGVIPAVAWAVTDLTVGQFVSPYTASDGVSFTGWTALGFHYGTANGEVLQSYERLYKANQQIDPKFRPFGFGSGK